MSRHHTIAGIAARIAGQHSDPPPRLPDGTRVHVRSPHFAHECDGRVADAEYDGGWLYRIEVTAGDRLDGERNADGELWVCDFEVQPVQEKIHGRAAPRRKAEGATAPTPPELSNWMSPHTPKKYRCRRCGHVAEQTTNHWGPTYSWGHTNACPKCPPWAKYPEFGGQTVWDCLDRPEGSAARSAVRETPHGDGSVSRVYEVGDIVELTEDERYSMAPGRKGEWGRVYRVREPGSSVALLDIQLAGYSRDPDAFFQAAVGVPSWIVKPRGEPAAPPPEKAPD